MFKKFKLICTAIGLVAVLVLMLIVLPGGAQKLPSDLPFSPWTPPFNPGRPEPDTLQPNPLTREGLVQTIHHLVTTTFTASEGDIWDTQCAGIYSSPFITFTYIPASPYSRSIERLLAGDFDHVPLFIFYLHENGASKPVVRRQIEPGAYMAKLVSPTKVVFVDQEGNEVLSGKSLEQSSLASVTCRASLERRESALQRKVCGLNSWALEYSILKRSQSRRDTPSFTARSTL